jgi:hypothetical protein
MTRALTSVIAFTDWLQGRLGREPRAGDTIQEGAARFVVLQTRRQKAHRVLVESL